MNPHELLALALDPGLILQAQGIAPDPWQRELLLCPDPRVAMLCSRGAGKSRAVSALALHTALFQPNSLTLLISRAQRQSLELFRYVKQGFNALSRPIDAVKENETTLELANGSRVVALPGKEGTIRAFQGVTLLIIDEAARVPDDLYFSVRPMLGVSKGRLVLLSTPFGRRGFFHKEYEHGGDSWRRFKITWRDCPRITEEFIAKERASLGPNWVEQEYECRFTALEGLVYPDFDDVIWDAAGVARGTLVGGIDFGWRNPFCALWGAIDRDTDILRIVGERYLRETPLHEHVAFLKSLGTNILWYADPAGATEIHELRAAGLRVRKGDNDIRLGIQAVTARLRSKRLIVSRVACPNLIAESRLYRYPDAQERAIRGEKPIDEHNHALAALRYLVSRLDAHLMARLRKSAPSHFMTEEEQDTIGQDEARVRAAETRSSLFGVDQWQDDDLWERM